MRLWHKDLITVLPKQQLIGQWRECCLIEKNIRKKGKPNHLLVNKIMDFPIDHFLYYCYLVATEMKRRGYRCDENKIFSHYGTYCIASHQKVFRSWHNNRYLKQCYYNLQEKFDCGAVPEEEWKTFFEFIFPEFSASERYKNV